MSENTLQDDIFDALEKMTREVSGQGAQQPQSFERDPFLLQFDEAADGEGSQVLPSDSEAFEKARDHHAEMWRHHDQSATSSKQSAVDALEKDEVEAARYWMGEHKRHRDLAAHHDSMRADAENAVSKLAGVDPGQEVAAPAQLSASVPTSSSPINSTPREETEIVEGSHYKVAAVVDKVNDIGAGLRSVKRYRVRKIATQRGESDQDLGTSFTSREEAIKAVRGRGGVVEDQALGKRKLLKERQVDEAMLRWLSKASPLALKKLQSKAARAFDKFASGEGALEVMTRPFSPKPKRSRRR